MLYQVQLSPWARFELTTLVVIGTDCTWQVYIQLSYDHDHGVSEPVTITTMTSLNQWQSRPWRLWTSDNHNHDVSEPVTITTMTSLNQWQSRPWRLWTSDNHDHDVSEPVTITTMTSLNQWQSVNTNPLIKVTGYFKTLLV
jgi:hypothetical protein